MCWAGGNTTEIWESHKLPVICNSYSSGITGRCKYPVDGSCVLKWFRCEYDILGSGRDMGYEPRRTEGPFDTDEVMEYIRCKESGAREKYTGVTMGLEAQVLPARNRWWERRRMPRITYIDNFWR